MCSWDIILDYLQEYLLTDEGQDTLRRMEELHRRINGRLRETESELVSRESRALRFIKRELKRGHSPSVREVARAVGFKSSRSGSRLLNKLMLKGMIQRTEKRKFVICETLAQEILIQ